MCGFNDVVRRDDGTFYCRVCGKGMTAEFGEFVRETLPKSFYADLMSRPVEAASASPGKETPHQHHQQPDSEARPDYPALAVWPRRDKGNVPVA